MPTLEIAPYEQYVFLRIVGGLHPSNHGPLVHFVRELCQNFNEVSCKSVGYMRWAIKMPDKTRADKMANLLKTIEDNEVKVIRVGNQSMEIPNPMLGIFNRERIDRQTDTKLTRAYCMPTQQTDLRAAIRKQPFVNQVLLAWPYIVVAFSKAPEEPTGICRKIPAAGVAQVLGLPNLQERLVLPS